MEWIDIECDECDERAQNGMETWNWMKGHRMELDERAQNGIG